MSVTKSKRTKKVSAGIHGAKKHPLSYVEKILIGKGAYAATEEVTTDRGEPIAPWYGVEKVAKPAFPEQAELNKELYPSMFRD